MKEEIVLKNAFLLFLYCNLISALSYSKNVEYAPTSTLQSDSEESVLLMSCSGTKPFDTMSCEFIQKSIRREYNENDNLKKKMTSLTAKEVKSNAEQIIEQCKDIKKEKSKAPKIESLKKTHEDNVTILEKFCNCAKGNNQKMCLEEFAEKFDEIKKKTCRFTTNQFNVDFKRISKNKWMNTPEPKGLCNVVNAVTLEFDGKYTWKFTQVRLSADKDNKWCDFDLNKTLVYESGMSTHKIDCEYIELGY